MVLAIIDAVLAAIQLIVNALGASVMRSDTWLYTPYFTHSEVSVIDYIPLTFTPFLIVVTAIGAVLGQQNTSSEQPPAQYGRR